MAEFTLDIEDVKCLIHTNRRRKTEGDELMSHCVRHKFSVH